MENDPIVDEVRQARAEIFRTCENDLDKLLDRYRQAESKDQDRVVSFQMLCERRKTLSPAK
jgi:hypothetical protein